MNAPNPTLMVQEFARRTRVNLEFIEINKKRSNADIFEVTQLINSMLGLLIFPVEKLLQQGKEENKFDDIYLSEIRFKTVTANKNYSKSNIRRLLRMIRNAFSHGNIHLGYSSEISYIQLWNYPTNKERIRENENWRIEIHHSQLRKLVLSLCRVLEEDLSTLDPAGEGIRALREKPDLLAEDAA